MPSEAIGESFTARTSRTVHSKRHLPSGHDEDHLGPTVGAIRVLLVVSMQKAGVFCFFTGNA